MKKAVAIVNEQGGLTSHAAIVTETGGIITHAAIVSRELRIPCVVAVEGITQDLNDGDILKVDANKGVVRKLKY